MAYAYLTAGKTKPQIRDIDRALAGPEGESPAEIAKRNREAMAALGQIGQLPPRKKAKKETE